MRILLIPRFEKTAGDGSLTIIPLQFVRIGMELDKYLYMTIVVDKRFENKDWLGNYDIPKEYSDRIEFLPIDLTDIWNSSRLARKMGYMMGSALSKKISPNGRKNNFYDIAVSNAFPSNPIIKMSLNWGFRRGLQRDIPLIGWNVWTANEEWDDTFLFNEFDAITEMFGHLVCDRVIFESATVKKNFHKMFLKYYNGTYIKKFLEKTYVIPNGINVIPKYETKKYDKVKIVWSGYYSADGEEVIDVMLKAYELGYVDEVFVSFLEMPADKILEDLTQKPLRIIAPKKQSEYIDFLRGMDIVVSMSKGETYGTRLGEAILAGACPVMLKEITDIFMPDEYPFVVESKSKLLPTIKAAVDKLKSDHDFMKSYIKYVYDNHNMRDMMTGFYTLVNETTKEFRAKMNFGDFGAAVQKTLEDVKECSHVKACELISKNMRTPMDLRNNSMFPPGTIRWAILDSGFVDTGGSEPYYVKE